MTIDILESQFAAKCTIQNDYGQVEKEQHQALFEIELDKRTAILREQVVAHLHSVERDATSKAPFARGLWCVCEHIKLPAKILDYFSRSKKSNINQCVCV